MSQQHDKTQPQDVAPVDGIDPQPAPFEPGYQPETLPQISVPDLPDDAQGLSAEALAQVPTLTEQVDAPAASEPAPEVAAPTVEAVAQPQAPETESPEAVVAIQDAPVQADTWGEELHVRMGKLTDDIHTLNARLDRLEEKNKAKV